MSENIHKLLLRSFDADLTVDEKSRLDRALADSESLRLEHEQMKTLRKAVEQGVSHSFRPFFADRVMSRLKTIQKSNERFDPFFESLMHLFKPVLVAAAVLIAIMISYNAVRHEGTLLASESKVTLEDAFDPVYEWIQE